MSTPPAPGHAAAAPLLRRQLVLAGVAGGVSLLAVAAVMAAASGGEAVHATLRPGGDGSFTAVAPRADSSRAALWAAATALVAVGAVLVASVGQVWRIVRFVASGPAGRHGDPDGATAPHPAKEVC